LAVLLILILAAAAATLAAYCIAFRSPDKTQNDIYNIPPGEQYQAQRPRMRKLIEELAAVPYEEVFITNREGLRLRGQYYHRVDGAPVALCFHGYRGTSIRDFCGGAQIAFSLGQNVLLVDQRSCGGSEGHVITFGLKERFDCLEWIDYVLGRFGADTRITLYGVSMGAAMVLMATELDLPENVYAVIADSPYSSPEAIIRKVCGDMKLPPVLMMPFVRLAARLCGFSISGGGAAEAVKSAKIPILLIHGEDDRFVPCDMSREIRAANPEKITLHTFPKAGHGISFIEDQPRYQQLVLEFLGLS